LELNQEQVKKAVEIIEEKKGYDISILNLKEISFVTDYFIIVSANSTTQVKAITDNLEEKLPDAGIPILRVEGRAEARWVLVDCGDIVIHVMTPETREFYHLERLWGDAEVLTGDLY